MFGSPEKLLPGLLQWKSAHVPSQMYGTRNFRAFLPPSSDWPVGKPYYIIEDRNEFTPMNRYHPPNPSDDNSLLHSILAQFHPNVFLLSRFGPKGTVCSVRARTKNLLDIVFRYVWTDMFCVKLTLLQLSSRIHAEYQINQHPDYPFWFTPAQFSGRLVTDNECHHIYHFELNLPTDNQLNIGINIIQWWLVMLLHVWWS